MMPLLRTFSDRLPRAWTSRRERGSVLVIVMVTLLFATFALVTFMEKASVDLLVDHREVIDKRLRMEAYSALETTLAVLEDFRAAGDGLRSPAEGWSNPLEFAGYEPGEDRVVEVRFEDESGKISLPLANAVTLTNLFVHWGILQNEAETLADALMGWMKRDHVYSTAVVPNYEGGAIPYEPPGRSLRSYHELAAIERVREVFYDRDGRPTDYWRRFVDTVSLLRFEKPNLNGAKPDTLAALGQFDETQQRTLGEYLAGGGTYQHRGPGYFASPTDAQQIAGPAGNVAAFATTISALRIFVTVREGRSEFRLAAVVAPPNGATVVQTPATRSETSTAAAQTTREQQNRPNAQQRAGAAAPTTESADLKYPFTLLEIRENDEIPPPPPPLETLI